MPLDFAAHHGIPPEAAESNSSDVRDYWKSEIRSRSKARKAALRSKEERARLLQTVAYVAIVGIMAVIAAVALVLGIGTARVMWGAAGEQRAASPQDSLFSRESKSAVIKELTSESSLNQVCWHRLSLTRADPSPAAPHPASPVVLGRHPLDSDSVAHPANPFCTAALGL